MLEAESEPRGPAHGGDGSLALSLAVPSSLQASADGARLDDRLGAAKEAAQIGAAIGREFSQCAAGGGGAEVRGGSWNRRSDRLIEAGLLSRQGAPPQASYLFKHTLGAGCRLWDAAAGSLGARFTPVSPKAWSTNSARSPIANRRSWHASLHRGWAGSREGRGTVGQGGTAFARPLGADRSLSPTRPGPRADRDLARHADTASLSRSGLRVALITPLIHVNGYAAPETKAAVERAPSADRTSGRPRRGARRSASTVPRSSMASGSGTFVLRSAVTPRWSLRRSSSRAG